MSPRLIAYCHGGLVTYNASKAAIVEISKSMSLDLGPLIRVNCICPGVTLTRRWSVYSWNTRSSPNRR